MTKVVEFLCRSGLPEDKKDDITFNQNGSVTVRNLDDGTSRSLIEVIHGKQNFGKKLFCNGIVPLTPKKDNQAAQHQQASASATPPASPVRAQPTSPAKSPTGSAAGSVKPVTSEIFVPNLVLTEKAHPDNSQVTVRQSTSSDTRTPPSDSIADLTKTKLLVNEVKDCLSDFGSCISETSGDDETGDSDSDDNKAITGDKVADHNTMNEKKRLKKLKRKLRVTPGKEQFLKKANMAVSPQYQSGENWNL